MRKGIPTAGYVCNGRFGSEGGHYMNDAPKGRSGSLCRDLHSDPLRNFDGHDIEVGLLGKNGHPLVETRRQGRRPFQSFGRRYCHCCKALGSDRNLPKPGVIWRKDVVRVRRADGYAKTPTIGRGKAKFLKGV
jgi:hypothetical protein